MYHLNALGSATKIWTIKTNYTVTNPIRFEPMEGHEVIFILEPKIEPLAARLPLDQF